MTVERRGGSYARAALLSAAAALSSLGIAVSSAPWSADAAALGYTFDTGVEGFTALASGAVSQSATNPRTGAGDLVVGLSSSAEYGPDGGAVGPVLSGYSTASASTATITGYARSTSGTVNTNLCLRYSRASGTAVSCVGSTSVTATGYTLLSASVSVPAGATSVQVQVYGASSTVNIRWDDVTVDSTALTAAASATPTPTPTPTPTATPTPTPTSTPTTSASATPSPSPSATTGASSGTVTLDGTQYGQLFALLFGFCSLALVLLAVIAGRNVQ